MAVRVPEGAQVHLDEIEELLELMDARRDPRVAGGAP
jgi:hypothetical protein